MGDSRRLDRILGISALVLGLVVVGFAAYFGYNVYVDRKAAEEATPAGRIAKVIAQQVRKAPNDAILRVRYGEALASAGRTKDAIEQFNAALKIDPKHTGAMIDLGQIALSDKQASTASRYFKQVVDLTAGSTMEDVNQRREIALYQLGRIALSQNEWEQAIGYFKGALRIRNDASDTYYYLARAFDGNGDADEAMRQLEIAVKFDPNFAQARYFLGDLYMAQGDKVLASYNYGKAAQIAPDAPEPQAAIAKFGTPEELIAKAKTLLASDPEAALESARIARNIDFENPDAAKMVAMVLAEQGEYKLALATYKEAEKFAPQDAEIKAAIEELSKKVKSQPKPKGK
jgi:tetratricopeptide (TPR) repeat protein